MRGFSPGSPASSHKETFSAERTAASSTGTLQPKDLDECSFCCSICLDLLKDPLTIPCGHSYCRKCLQGLWDAEENVHSCPQSAPAGLCYAGPEDVVC
uniref:RING-type domain-containing protein n=1 Tax=Oryzias sinensis TaxID=183150 RepID=A0A8C7WRX2_9TELE